MIELKGVTKVYKPRRQRELQAVIDINLEVSEGEFVVITGRSGCGKTTLLNLIAGMTRPTSGHVFVDGIDIWDLTDEQLSAMRSQKMGFMFQVPSLISTLSVLDNVVVPTMFVAKEKQLAVYQRASKVVESVGLSYRADALPRHLSAGEEKRTVIARALINEPPVLLADEPTANLDEETEKEIMSLLEDIHRQRGVTIILVTHHPSLIGYGTRHITMADGRLKL
jgi:ABC-type lipoprotein export system ATPase subunit